MEGTRRGFTVMILATIVLLTIPSLSSAEGGWLSPHGAKAGSPPAFSVQAEGTTGVLLDVSVPGIRWVEVTTKGGPFVKLDLAGAGVTTEIGAPQLPVIRRLVEVPQGAQVSLEVESAVSEDLPLASAGILRQIVPVQAPVPKVPGARENAPFLLNASRYALDGYQPAGLAELGAPASIRGHRVVQVSIYPFQYNPVQAKAKVVSRLRVRVRCEGGDLAKTAAAAGKYSSPSFDRSLKREIVNYGQIEAVKGPKANPAEGVLIITGNAYEVALASLVDWKRKKGYRVEVVPTSTTGSTNTQIKSYIQSAFDSWSDPPLSFVILVGDTDTIPSFNGTTGAHVSDLSYATLSGTDWLPDVRIGRISVASSAQAQSIVDRLVNYELAEFSSTAWIKDATFIATCDSGYYDVAEGTHNFVIANHMDPAGYTSDKLYCITYGATTADVTAAVNAGRSIVTYSGHGSETSWAGPTFTTTNVNNLTNGERTPFVTGHACVTGSFQLAECFAEKWLRKTAVGYWGASDNSYWDEDDYLEKGMYEAVYVQNLYLTGEMVQYGLDRVYDAYGGAGLTHYYYEMYHLFGDPTLEIWTGEPGTLAVSHDAEAAIGDSIFSVSVFAGATPLEGALVCVYKPADGVHETGVTGPAGDVTIPLDPVLGSLGALFVTVTAHDYQPYLGTAAVTFPAGPYLQYNSHTFDDSAGNGDGYANPGETVLMPVTLENIGTDPCTAGTATLQTTSAWVEVMTDNTADFPVIPAAGTGTSLFPHFSWKSYAGTPDRTTIPFTIDWACDGGAGGVASFSAEICADADGDGSTTCAGDCDDGDPAVNPGAAEICDGADNDCDGLQDEGFSDLDGDGAASCVDCDDGDAARYPGAAEICDGKDNDCDLVVPAEETDADTDGYYVCEDDCNDGNAAVNPGATENCTNGIDDDCDGKTDAADSNCAQPWGAASSAEASVTDAAPPAESGACNALLLLLGPAAAVLVIRRRRRRV